MKNLKINRIKCSGIVMILAVLMLCAFQGITKPEDKLIGVWISSNAYCTPGEFTLIKAENNKLQVHRYDFRGDGTMTEYAGAPGGWCGTVSAHHWEGSKGPWKMTSDSTLSFTTMNKDSKYFNENNWVIVMMTGDTMRVRVRDSKDVSNTAIAPDKFDWNDTTLTSVRLKETGSDRKVVAFKIKQRATVYMKAESIKQWVLANSNDFNKDDLATIVKQLESIKTYNDTITISSDYAGNIWIWPGIKFVVSEQLKNGNANVFYDKTNSFVPTISERLEKYGRVGYRFFYMPDGNPFFQFIEYTKIIENDNYLPMDAGVTELRAKLRTMGD